MTTEVVKSHDLLSANWRPKKANGVVLVQIHRSENQRSQQYKPQSKYKGSRIKRTDVQGQEMMNVSA